MALHFYLHWACGFVKIIFRTSSTSGGNELENRRLRSAVLDLCVGPLVGNSLFQWSRELSILYTARRPLIIVFLILAWCLAARKPHPQTLSAQHLGCLTVKTFSPATHRHRAAAPLVIIKRNHGRLEHVVHNSTLQRYFPSYNYVDF